MLKALERSIASVDERIVLLAPSTASVSDFFKGVDVDGSRHEQLLQDVQRFRGQIYLNDGAIGRQDLSADGRHQTPEDNTGWHMLLLDKEQQVSACVLYREHDNAVPFDHLRIRQCPLADDKEWQPRLRKAIQSELSRARRDGLRYVEVGGWAASERSRGTVGPLILALAAYGFGRLRGGALGLTTATFRHCSSIILKRLGGSRFDVDGVTLPPYYDPRYGCMMEMLRFDSRQPNPKYVGFVEQLRDKFADVLVIARPPAVACEESRPLFAA